MIAKHPLYLSWWGMMKRCFFNPVHQNRYNFGESGIKVVPEWHVIQNYIAYVEDVLGEKPGPEYSIDRIDNDGDYEPGNLRWAPSRVAVDGRGEGGGGGRL